MSEHLFDLFRLELLADLAPEYLVLSEEVADDGETATVVLKVTYGDGSEEENTLKLRKDEEGNWKLDMGK